MTASLRPCSTASTPPPGSSIAHLSDVHLLARGVRQYGVVEPEAGLPLALERLRRLDPAPHALVFTGDLADQAEPEAYARLRELVEPVAAAMGAQVVWVMGNHDERAPYARGLFDYRRRRPQDRVYDVGGLRIVALDTSVPELPPRRAQPDQLDWLRERARDPGRARHAAGDAPPADPGADAGGGGDHRAARPGPAGRGRARAATSACILGGHFHYSSYSTFAGIPVSVASASCYTTDPAPLDRLISGVDGHQAFTMVHVYDDRIVHTVVPLAEAPEVTGYPRTCAPRSELLRPRSGARSSPARTPTSTRHEDHSPRE